MFGAILSGIGSLLGGIGSLIAPVVSGVGTITAPLISGAGGILGQLPVLSKAVSPFTSLWFQIEKSRTAEDVISKQYSIAQQQIQAQKDVAFQRVLLANQPAIIQAGQARVVQAKPERQIVTSAPPAAPQELDDMTFLILAGIGIIVILFLFLKK